MSESINLPVPIQTEGPLNKINDLLANKGDVLEWLGISDIYRFFYLYLFKKYKHNCRLYSDNFLGIRLEKTLEESKQLLLKAARQFKGCFDKGDEMIVIPLSFQSSRNMRHANIMVFKRATNTIERFEPYGYTKRIKKIPMVDKSIVYFVNEINKLIDKKIKYVPIEESCHEFGIQFIEEHVQTVKKEKNEGPGYCVIWSMFFTELSLANPELNIKQLTDIIYGINIPNLYFKNIARGYVYFFYEKMEKYFNIYLPQTMTFHKYVKNYKSRNIDTVILINETRRILNELFNIELELYENPNLTVEKLTEINKQKLKNLEKKIIAESGIIRKLTANDMLSSRDKIQVLEKMTLHKSTLNKFTPLIKKQPDVFIFDVKSSKMSDVATPIVENKQKTKTLKVKEKPPCKPGKERNEKGRCVNIKTVKTTVKEKPKAKEKPPCKPGKERNEKGRCVKIKTVKTTGKEKEKPIQKSKTLKIKEKPPCKPGKERNENGRCVKKENIK